MNKHTEKLLKLTPSNVLTELSLRMQIGSWDIPNDPKLAQMFLDKAEANATPFEKH